MNFRNWTQEQKAGFILRKLEDTRISNRLLRQIQSWLLSDESNDEKERLLENYFENAFYKRTSPSDRAYELLKDLHRRIGVVQQVKRPKHVSLGRRIFRVAAVVIPALVLIGGSMIWFKSFDIKDTTPQTQLVEYLTGSETQNEITLPDGSKVRLASNSRLTHPENFTDQRSVSLTGEAFFSVEKMDKAPFTVETENITVTVLGTEFNLQAYPNGEETVVSLTSGSVRVDDGNKQRVTLAPMEQFTYNNRTGVSEVKTFKPAQADRWKAGSKTLTDMPLPEALRTAGDFYGKEVVIQDWIPESKMVTTILLESASAESVLEAIRFIGDESFNYEIKDDTIFISKK